MTRRLSAKGKIRNVKTAKKKFARKLNFKQNKRKKNCKTRLNIHGIGVDLSRSQSF